MMSKQKNRKKLLKDLIDKGLASENNKDQSTKDINDDIKLLEDRLRKENAFLRRQIDEVTTEILCLEKGILKSIA